MGRQRRCISYKHVRQNGHIVRKCADFAYTHRASRKYGQKNLGNI